MKYTSNYNNILLLLYLLIPICIGSKIIFNETSVFDSIISIVLYLILVAVLFYFVIKKYVYIVDINNDMVTIRYVLKKSARIYLIEEIDKVVISITTGNTPNVILNFKDNSNTSFTCSDRNDLKRLYEYFVFKNIKINVIPKERINNFV